MIMKIPEMARSSSSAIIYFFLVFPFLIHAHQYCPDLVNYQCPDFNGRSVKYPFTNNSLPDCGFCLLYCNNHTNTTIQCGQQQLPYKTKEIFPNNSTVVLVYPGLFQLITDVCEVHQSDSVIIPAPPLTDFTILHLMVFFRCYPGQNARPAPVNPVTNCGEELVYGPFAADQIPAGIPADCSEIKLPNSTDDNFSIAYKLPDECSLCADDKRQCFDKDSGMYKCPAKRGKHKIQAIILSSGFLLVILAFLILYRRQRKAKQGSSRLDLGIISFKGTRSDLEEATLNGVTVFSYNELEEATNKFDSTKELGEGGFGIVYHGKLRDGREVAVKRLYEKSYKRIQQFKNEIKILTHLRHKNLVTLYGCTSHHSHELLLVYEYIPNGTVSDHLHGNHPNSNFINWSTRMNIAIETAEALCYLHYKDIIHRDIKTNNILLDNNFSVKVADFGLSRLFPQDVTHVSTAPQGTPGYLDPEYHQCYHLTDKSDVYSFGVVLAELLSSLPAVDVGRQRDEINLSKYAINKIQFCAFKELVDPRLGFEVDSKVRRMTTLVAEIAFQCLQQERELRPSMDEVLHGLKWIVSLDYDALEEMEAMKSMKALPSITENDGLKILTISSPGQPRTDSQKENDDVGLLKNAQNQPISPDSVMSKWSSKSSTPNTSS